MEKGTYNRSDSVTVKTLLIWSVLIYLLGYLCTLACSVSEDLAIGCFYVCSATALIRLWIKRKTLYPGLGGLMPVQILLIVSSIQKSLYLLDLIVSGCRTDAWPLETDFPARDWILGEVYTTSGTLISCAFLVRFEQKLPTLQTCFEVMRACFPILLFFYLAALACLGAFRFAPDLVSTSGQLLITCHEVGLVCCAIIPVYMVSRFKALLGCTLLTLPFVVSSLSSGMKEAIVFSAMPIAIWGWYTSRGAIGRIVFVASATVFLGIMTSYVSYFRGEVWYNNQEARTADVLESYAADARNYGLSKQVEDGMLSFLNRNHSARYRGWAVSAVEVYGYQPDMVFYPLTYGFIPRAFWPSKPAIQQGNQYNALIFGEVAALTGSSLSAGLYTSFFLGGGLFGVLLGALGVSFVIGTVLVWAHKLGGPFLVGLLTLSLLPSFIRNDEGWSVGALSGPIIQLCFICILFLVAIKAFGLRVPSKII